MRRRRDPKDLRAVFRGKRWRVVWETLPRRVDGMTDAPTTPGKAMRIRPGQRGVGELDTLLHEGLHACSWDLAEEAVAETARDLARFLWRLGYRRSEDGG